MKIFINNKDHTLSANNLLTQGGEAEIYTLSKGILAKIFKQPSHSDFTTKEERSLAAHKIQEYQTKLKFIPKGIPTNVVLPKELVYDHKDLIVGYTMPYLDPSEPLYRFGQKSFRKYTTPDIVDNIFRDLHWLLKRVHQTQTVVGDFTDLNVLVSKNKPWLIDFDSMQYGRYKTHVFTAKFLDPILSDPQSLVRIKDFSINSDWYAFALMYFNCLLLTSPYGGIYQGLKKIPHDKRPLQRVTVFDKKVKYPKPALPLGILSDDLLNQFYKIFAKDERGEFKLPDLHWKLCGSCGLHHSTNTCPVCQVISQVTKPVKETYGGILVETIFKTSGKILSANWYENNIYWIYYENSKYKNSWFNDTILSGDLNTDIEVISYGHNALFAKGNMVVSPQKDVEIYTDTYENKPVVATNSFHIYWAKGGSLYRTDQNILGANILIGQVVHGNTKIWAGEEYGFGFYKAGGLVRVFTYDVEKRGINDSTTLPRLNGNIISSQAYISSKFIWFFITLKQKHLIMNRVYVFDRNGQLQCSSEEQDGSPTWLGSIEGKCAISKYLLAATDEGLVRVAIQDGKIIPERKYLEAEPVVDSSYKLIPGNDGLYAIGDHDVKRLILKGD